MRRSTGLLAIAAALALVATHAPVASAENSQQHKMETCNKAASAKNLSGDDRKSFMSSCLSAAPAGTAKTNSQQEKMKSCNADATTKGLKGDARQAYMKTRLSGSSGTH